MTKGKKHTTYTSQTLRIQVARENPWGAISKKVAVSSKHKEFVNGWIQYLYLLIKKYKVRLRSLKKHSTKD